MMELPLQNRSLWPENEVEASSDGFLRIKELYGEAEEQQPLLLQSTTRLLCGMYPHLEISEIILQSGFREEPKPQKEVSKEADDGDNVEESAAAISQLSIDSAKKEDAVKNNHIPPQYQCYQDLTRADNMGNWISNALRDIQTFRHREGPKRPRQDRGDQKVKALEMQQQRLIKIRAESNLSKDTDKSYGDEEREGDNEDGDEVINKEEEDNAVEIEEAKTVRMVRTLNSVRALFPHLLPMLNHPRRNDKNLVIKKARYKSRKKGSMCWLIGTVAFDTSTTKAVISAHIDAKSILQCFIDAMLANEVVDDMKGRPDFWTAAWLRELQARSNPAILNPIDLLSTTLTKSRSEIVTMTRDVDRTNSGDTNNASMGMDQGYQKAVSKLQRRLSNLLTSRFRGARLSIYGSCLSNLSLGKGSDVDLSLWIPEADALKKGFQDGSIAAEDYHKKMTTFVHQAKRKLASFNSEFRAMFAITRARIPVITGTFIYANNPYTEDGSIDFDICFLNDIAVANSGLLHQYSLVDPRVRELMMAVKKWAKEFGISSAKDNFISSYTWMNLVIFYLQCIGFVPNLQSPMLMEEAGIVPDPKNNYWHFVNDLDTYTLKWDDLTRNKLWIMPEEFDGVSLPALLYGFYEFYGYRLPWMYAVSIKQGRIVVSKLATRKICLFYSIEDPFETYDSHCPHDLGMPASENGSPFIMDCLRDGEKYILDLIMEGKSNGKNLWPASSLVEQKPAKSNGNKKQPRQVKRNNKNAAPKNKKPGAQEGPNQQTKAKNGQKKGQQVNVTKKESANEPNEGSKSAKTTPQPKRRGENQQPNKPQQQQEQQNQDGNASKDQSKPSRQCRPRNCGGRGRGLNDRVEP